MAFRRYGAEQLGRSFGACCDIAEGNRHFKTATTGARCIFATPTIDNNAELFQTHASILSRFNRLPIPAVKSVLSAVLKTTRTRPGDPDRGVTPAADLADQPGPQAVQQGVGRDLSIVDLGRVTTGTVLTLHASLMRGVFISASKKP